MLHFFESFRYIYGSSLFFLYDTELANKFEALERLWRASVSHGEHYELVSFSRYRLMSNRPASVARTIAQDVAAARHALQDVIRYVRQNYVEVDIDATSKSALAAYLKYEGELQAGTQFKS